MKLWCIINVASLRSAEIHDYAPVGQKVLDEGFPRCFYVDKDVAEKELIRLQQRYGAGEFLLFESVAKAVPSLVVQAIHIDEMPF